MWFTIADFNISLLLVYHTGEGILILVALECDRAICYERVLLSVVLVRVIWIISVHNIVKFYMV